MGPSRMTRMELFPKCPPYPRHLTLVSINFTGNRAQGFSVISSNLQIREWRPERQHDLPWGTLLENSKGHIQPEA